MKLSINPAREVEQEVAVGALFGATDPFRHLALHLFDATDDALMLIEPDGQVIAANTAWTVLTGRSRLALVGQTIFSLAEVLDTDGLVDWLAGGFAAASDGVNGRVKFRHVNGFELDAEVAIEAILDADRTPVLWLVRLKPVRSDGYRSNRRRPSFRRVE